METTEQRLLRPSEVGERIGFCETKVRSLIKSGEISAVRVHGVIRVTSSAVDEFVASLPRVVTAD
jgi:excisionase family DNA binding protein